MAARSKYWIEPVIRSKGAKPRGWRTRWVLNGRSGSRSFKRKAEAEAFRDRIVAPALAVLQWPLDESNTPTLGRFATEVFLPSVTDETYRAWLETQLRLHVPDTLRRQRLDQIRRPHIIEALEARAKTAGSRSAIRAVRATLSALLTDAVRRELIDRSPLDATVKTPRLPAERRQRAAHAVDPSEVPTKAVLGKMLELMGAHGAEYRMIALIAAGAGLRFSEIAGLHPRDFDFDDPRGATVTVRRQLRPARHAGQPPSFPLPKGRKIRTVDISRDVVPALKSYLAGRALDEPVFRTPDGTLLDRSNLSHRVIQPVREALASWCAETDHPIPAALTLHTLRHYFATVLVSSISIAEASRQLGHATITTTLEYYTHWVEGDRDKAQAALQGAVL